MIQLKHTSNLIRQAINRHGEIKPCCLSGILIDAFTTYAGKVLFWYNDKDGSTHVVTCEL